VPVLLTLDARIRLRGSGGDRLLPLRELYAFNGMKHLKIEPGELLTEVVVPRPAAGTVGSYSKLRTRDAIDFPQLGLAVSLRQEDGAIGALDIVVGAINSNLTTIPTAAPNNLEVTEPNNVVPGPVTVGSTTTLGGVLSIEARGAATTDYVGTLQIRYRERLA
jgi:hypothetical protein